MLIILGGLAEFERELIKIRTSEGRCARRRAAFTWAHSALNQNRQREALARVEAGERLRAGVDMRTKREQIR